MSKHTKGPWKHDETWGLIVTAEGHEIAACHAGRSGTKQETQANARLISAAPELSSAALLAEITLQRLLDEVKAVKDSHLSFTVESTIAELQRALSKARGES